MIGALLLRLTAAPPMVVIDERDVRREEAPPHGAIGMSTAFRISDAVPQPRAMEFRRRVLHVHAAIGEHPLTHDEVYYVLSGEGEVVSDGVRDLAPVDEIIVATGLRPDLAMLRELRLGLDEVVSDHNTLCSVQNRLAAEGRCERLLAQADRQLDAAGLILRQGSMLDATVIATGAARPHFAEKGHE